VTPSVDACGESEPRIAAIASQFAPQDSTPQDFDDFAARRADDNGRGGDPGEAMRER
jgi:hypothetical protein